MIIDLSLPLYDKMPVYPGDPEVRVEQIQFFEKDGWNMRQIEISTHEGTHVNASIHGLAKGKSLDDYNLENFIGDSILFESFEDIQKGKGIIFNKDITWEDAKKIAEIKPKFVGSWSKNDIDVEIEKFLFENDILLFERLVNTDKLPKNFIFYGVPLKISDSDGSPVRAFAVI